MRLVVLDTNVIISAGIKADSPPFCLIHSFVLEDRVRILLCPSIISEYREVLARKKLAQYGFPPEWLEIMVSDGLEVPEPSPWKLRQFPRSILFPTRTTDAFWLWKNTLARG